MMRIALGVEYDGHDFHGWQAQNHLLTVQGSLEQALCLIANERVKVFCAGRTDAGVHATGQVVHFETNAIRELRAWKLVVNAQLTHSIAVKWAQEVDSSFHARFSALSRCYRYVIHNSSIRPALQAKRVAWYYRPLNAEIMHEAAQFLVGELDFSSFRSAECESRTPMRNIHYINVIRNNESIMIEIQANAFLHHMVRNIAGVLIRIGTGAAPPIWAQEVLFAKDRRKAAETAPASGLYLCHVNYPDHYTFPASEPCFK